MGQIARRAISTVHAVNAADYRVGPSDRDNPRGTGRRDSPLRASRPIHPPQPDQQRALDPDRYRPGRSTHGVGAGPGPGRPRASWSPARCAGIGLGPGDDPGPAKPIQLSRVGSLSDPPAFRGDSSKHPLGGTWRSRATIRVERRSKRHRARNDRDIHEPRARPGCACGRGACRPASSREPNAGGGVAA